jgi:hypothetical protein
MADQRWPKLNVNVGQVAHNGLGRPGSLKPAQMLVLFRSPRCWDTGNAWPCCCGTVSLPSHWDGHSIPLEGLGSTWDFVCRRGLGEDRPARLRSHIHDSCTHRAGPIEAGPQLVTLQSEHRGRASGWRPWSPWFDIGWTWCHAVPIERGHAGPVHARPSLHQAT